MSLSEDFQDCNEIQSLDYEGRVVEFIEVDDVKEAVKELKETIKKPYPKNIDNKTELRTHYLNEIDKIFGDKLI